MRPMWLNFGRWTPFGSQDFRCRADELPMSGGKPRKSADPLYLLLREGGSEEFNRRSKAGETGDFRGCDFRGIVSLSRTGARALMQIDSTQVSLVELPSSIFS